MASKFTNARVIGFELVLSEGKCTLLGIQKACNFASANNGCRLWLHEGLKPFEQESE